MVIGFRHAQRLFPIRNQSFGAILCGAARSLCRLGQLCVLEAEETSRSGFRRLMTPLRHQRFEKLVSRIQRADVFPPLKNDEVDVIATTASSLG